jgi:hypothetical protein
MKTYSCDICGKQFGHNVGFVAFGQPQYTPGDFQYDSGFFRTQRSDADICNDCYNAIAEAQEKAIKKLNNKES